MRLISLSLIMGDDSWIAARIVANCLVKTAITFLSDFDNSITAESNLHIGKVRVVGVISKAVFSLGRCHLRQFAFHGVQRAGGEFPSIVCKEARSNAKALISVIHCLPRKEELYSSSMMKP